MIIWAYSILNISQSFNQFFWQIEHFNPCSEAWDYVLFLIEEGKANGLTNERHGLCRCADRAGKIISSIHASRWATVVIGEDHIHEVKKSAFLLCLDGIS